MFLVKGFIRKCDLISHKIVRKIIEKVDNHINNENKERIVKAVIMFGLFDALPG